MIYTKLGFDGKNGKITNHGKMTVIEKNFYIKIFFLIKPVFVLLCV